MLSGCHATLVLGVLNIASEGELLNGRIYREAVIWRDWQLRCAGCTMAGRAARGQSQICESKPSLRGLGLLWGGACPSQGGCRTWCQLCSHLPAWAGAMEGSAFPLIVPSLGL